MPTEFNQSIISSLNSVISSIENDRQVYRWFLMLISLPEIQQKLSTNNKTKNEYQALKNIQLSEIIAYLVLILIMTVSCLLKQPLVLLLESLPVLILVNLFRKNREMVAAISEQFLQENIQPDELSKQTLYQTCEYFSQKYLIPSLVDIITFQDFIGRKVLLGTVLILPFICSFKSWQIWALTITLFLTTLAIVNTSIVLKKLVPRPKTDKN